MLRALVLLLLLTPSTVAAGVRTRAVVSRFDTARSILFIAAHPDDETVIAPLLGRLCHRGGVTCSIIVLTRGEGGGDPDVRTGEMVRSAALLNLQLTQWSYPDVFTPEEWPVDEIANRIRSILASDRPDLILTFDPLHGTTGHPAHKAVGQLVLDLTTDDVFVISTGAVLRPDSIELFNAAPGKAWTWVARGDWDYLVRAVETHASQFNAAQIESLRNAAEEMRRVWLKPAR